MYINSKNKQLQLEPLRGIITQGEKLADTVTFALPNVYGNLTLSSLGWSIRAASEKNTLATASLTVSVMEDKCLLSWEVSSDFTAVSGALSLMLVGTDGDGKIVIKFPGDSPIWVRDSETGEYSPPEDAIENAIEALKSAEEALKNAIEALQSIGVNLKILGWYPTLEALQAAVTNPSPGDAYGVGDPTVVYVWNGTSWAPLPGVFQPYPHNNLLVNPRFKYNSRGQSTYTGAVRTVDGWQGGANLATSVINNGVTLSPVQTGTYAIFQQNVFQANNLAGKTVTFSVATSDGNITSVTQLIPSGTFDGDNVSISGTQWYIDIFSSANTALACRVISTTSAQSSDSITLTAAKLELGSVSTLQAELDNPPPEDVEKLKLDMYSLDPGRCAYLPWHNENLLDNWYFVGGGSQQGGGQFPINQRGETSYAAGGYGIDRWNAAPQSTVSINSGYITFETNSEATVRKTLQQTFENKWLIGQRVTLSILCADGTFACGSAVFPSTGYATVFSLPGICDGRLFITGAGNPAIYFINAAGESVNLVAAKLELGYLSTLARKDEEGNWVLNDPPPNFQQELAKCQRYLVMGPLEGLHLTVNGIYLPTPVTMRTTPSIVGAPLLLKVEDNAQVSVSMTPIFVVSNGVVFSYIHPADPLYAYFPDGSGLSCEL